jgi:hypothetical protein
MGTGCDDLCNGVGEGAGRVDVEYRVRVLAIVHTALGEDDGDEVGARRVEEREGWGIGEKLDVDVRNVANNILVVVEHRQRSDALGVHEEQSFFERMIAIDGYDFVTAQIQLLQRTIVQLLDRLEASSVLP